MEARRQLAAAALKEAQAESELAKIAIEMIALSEEEDEQDLTGFLPQTALFQSMAPASSSSSSSSTAAAAGG